VDGCLVKGTGSADLPRSISLGLGARGLPGQAPRTVDASDLADKLQARLWAESSQIVSIGLAEDCILDKPILLEWVETGKAAYRAPLIFLNLGAGAGARFDLLWTSEGQGPGCFLSPAFRVDLGAGAKLGLFELVDLDAASRFLDYPRASLAAGAELDWTRGFLGTGVVTSRLGAELEGRASRFNLSSSWAVGSGRHLEAAVVQHHRGEGSWSRSRFEGAVDGDGRAICRGLIKVDKTAIGTDAYLSSRLLALSPEARTVSLPELAIDTNELTASHGSTVGSVGPEELFYLGTRGLSPAQAKALVAAGLLGGLLSRTPPELAGYVEARIDQVLEPPPIGSSP
jgi:Fe-S cluster assembly protein SufD